MIQKSLICCIALSIKLFAGFASGTLVKVPQGYRAIETLKPGNVVYSITKSGNCSLSKVKRVTSYFLSRGVVISVDKHVMITAPKQKFYNPHDNSWCKAKYLKKLMPLLSGYKDICCIDDIECIDDEVEYFDIRLESDHTFFVTKNDLVVHNFPPFFIGFSIAWGSGISFEGVYIGLCIAGYWLGTKFLKHGNDQKYIPSLNFGNKSLNSNTPCEQLSGNREITQNTVSSNIDEQGSTITSFYINNVEEIKIDEEFLSLV